MARESITQKAGRLLGEGKVGASTQARIYPVEGDGGDVYLVTISPTVRMCPCDARGGCSHIEACVALENADAELTAKVEEARERRREEQAAKADEAFRRLGA